MSLATRPFDAAEYLDTPDAVAAYLDSALASGDGTVIADALGVVARARGMTQLARDAAVPRPTLYKALQASGRPELATVLKVMGALGVRLFAQPTDAAPIV